jgi:hypothetical protein
MEIYLIISKKHFENIFLGIGWRIISWINDEKVKIFYRK